MTGKGTQYVYLLYTFALRLAKRSQIFSASIPTLAAYFRVNEKTVRAAIQLLVEIGFFERVSSESGVSVRYRPLTHKEWAAKHPAECTEKEEMPWSGERQDELGKMLYAISGGRFKPYVNFLRGMRKTGHSDAAIADHFRTFLQTYQPHDERPWAMGLCSRFLSYLRAQTVAVARAA